MTASLSNVMGLSMNRYWISSFLILGWLLTSAQDDQVSPSDFFTSGEAVLTGTNCFQLTQERLWSSGGVWHKSPIDLRSSFSMDLRLMFGCDDMGGADGVVFVFTPLRGVEGYQGEGMGFAGLQPSLGIEIDTWENEHLFDPPEDHIAILQDGYVNHYYNLVGPKIIPNVEDCKLHDLNISWNEKEKVLEVTLDGRKVISYQGDLTTEIFRNNPVVYWGVTSATGKYFNRHEICFDQIHFTMPLDVLEFSPSQLRLLEKGQVQTLEDVKFKSGRTTISNQSLPDLHRVINFLKEHPELHLGIEGHTDNLGSEELNKTLSVKRAAAIGEYLRKQGVPSNRIHSEGYGEGHPAEDNSTPQGRAKNRRIDIYFFNPRT